MTILPNSNKKKPQQGTSQNERELSESSNTNNHNQHANHPLQISNISARNSPLQGSGENSNLYVQSIASSGCWSNPGQRDDLTLAHNHRSSSIGSVRPKIREYRGKASPPYPNPSTSNNNAWGPKHEANQTSALDSHPREPPMEANKKDPTEEEECSGYNSGDEYAPFQGWRLTDDEWEEKERSFEKKMKKKNLIIKKMAEDGACLFRAIADQVYGDQEFHAEVRCHCMNYIQRNSDAFEPFVSEPFPTYVERKRREDCFGNHVEIAAMSEMYNRVIEVYSYSSDPINIFQGSLQTDNAPIKLSYHRGTHYNSLINPYKATIGVGLGLPNLQPGLAEKNLMKDATVQSENFHLEQTMLEDKMRVTDHEATSDAIQEQIVQQSYIDWLAQQEGKSGSKTRSQHDHRCLDNATEAGTSVQSSDETAQERVRSPTKDKSEASGSSKWQDCTEQTPVSDIAVAGPSKENPSSSKTPFQTVPSHFLNVQDCSNEEASILAQVLALSQQEYLETLKSSHEQAGTSGNNS